MKMGPVEVESGTVDLVEVVLLTSLVAEEALGRLAMLVDEASMSLVRVLPNELYQSAKNSTLDTVPEVESQL